MLVSLEVIQQITTFPVSVVWLATSTLDVVFWSRLRKTVGGDASHAVVPDLGAEDSCVGSSLFFVEGSTPFLEKVYVFVVKVLFFVVKVLFFVVKVLFFVVKVLSFVVKVLSFVVTAGVVCPEKSSVYVYPRSVLLRCLQIRKMTMESDVGSCGSYSSLKLLWQV